MKKHILIIATFAAAGLSAFAADSISFSPGANVVEIIPEKSTGLNSIQVIENAEGATISYSASGDGNNVVWYRFGQLGGAYAEEITGISHQGATSSMTLGTEDFGLIIEEGSRRIYFWIVNYANHQLELDGLGLSSESDCMTLTLDVDGEGDAIRYYTINGAPKTLDRQIGITYTTLEYDKANECYKPVRENESTEYIHRQIHIPQPLCDTQVTMSGDRFLKAWNREKTVSSDMIQATAVSATTSAVQSLREVDNEGKVETSSGLGGSAPVEIEFTAAVTDAARFTEWQIAATPEFTDIIMRDSSTDFTHVFNEYGSFSVRFVAANSDGSCDWISPTYDVEIGESMLLCPNAFSPGASEGVNDEWRVSYKSIVDFDCHIFNRWGVKVATLTDPSQGWDGRHGGKLVPSGVYYYVIKAKGADGRAYNLSGDINIINYRLGDTPSSVPTE